MQAIAPETYACWRDTRLGTLTERVERDVVLDLAGPLVGRRALDLGCGDGTYCIAAARQGARVTAVDGSYAMLEAARIRAGRAGVEVRFEPADAHRLPFADQCFDLVFAVTLLCFVDDATRVATEIARVLAPGGRLVLADLNRWSTWAAWRRARGWLGSPTWRAARFRTARELARLVESAGLEVERSTGAVYFPPVGSLASLFAPFDRRIGAATTLGAAFLAVAARKRC